MEMLGRYCMTTALSNKDAGSCRWCFATRDGKDFFIKEFLSPKYPENDTHSTPEKRQKKLQKCLEFEKTKSRIYHNINLNSDGNAVRVEEFFRVGAKYYMVMPKLKPTNIEPEQIARLPMPVKVRICGVIAHAVACLHKAGFVHSDIKHSNIMLVHTANGSLTAKVIDYDAGFLEENPPVEAEAIEGDQVYFSPEVWNLMLGIPALLTCKLDVFALGILFHQYFTGQVPGYDQSAFGCAGEAVAEGQTLEISNGIPENYRTVIEQMLHADPIERPTAQQVYEAFLRPVPVKPPVAPAAPTPPPPPEPLPGGGDGLARGGFFDMGDL